MAAAMWFATPGSLTHPAVVEALVRKLGPEFLVELLEIRAALGPLIGRLAAQRSVPEDAEALRVALAAVQEADSAAARQAADLAYFRVLIHSSRNRALGLLYRWVEHAFGGREHELTAAYDDAAPVVADLRAITEAVLARDAAAAAAAVEAYLRASALRMVEAYQSQATCNGPGYQRCRVAGCTAMSPNLLRRLHIAASSA